MNANEVINGLRSNGFVVVNGLVNQGLLSETNDILNKSFDYSLEQRKGYAGFTMGNLAIRECYLHQKIFDELHSTIKILSDEFDFCFITGGGNYNLPNSRQQKFHFDNLLSNLTINIPLVPVTMNNGPMKIVGNPGLERYTTAEFFIRRLFKESTYLTSDLGDVIFRFSNLWHAGTANKASAPRPMLTFTLRKELPFKNSEKSERYLIEGRVFSSDIGFYGNVYPDNGFGKFIERCDILFPALSKGMQHGYNILRGR